MPVERRGPTGAQRLRQHGRQGRDDNGAHQSARPAAEALRQGEGREGLAVLGPVRSRGQAGDAPRGVRDGQAERRRSGYRRGDVRGHRGSRGGTVSGAATGRTGLTHLPATAEPARRDTQGRRTSPRPRDSADSGPGGARGAQTHLGADLRSRLSRRVVRVSTEADSPAGGRPGGRGHRAEQDAGDRR